MLALASKVSSGVISNPSVRFSNDTVPKIITDLSLRKSNALLTSPLEKVSAVGASTSPLLTNHK